MERRLPKPSATAMTSRPHPASPHRRRQPLSTPLTLLESKRPQSTATPAFPHRTPPPARCHTGGVPLERRLPKPSTYDEPHTDVNAGALPVKVACPQERCLLKNHPPRLRHCAHPCLGAASTAYGHRSGASLRTVQPAYPHGCHYRHHRPCRHGPASLLSQQGRDLTRYRRLHRRAHSNTRARLRRPITGSGTSAYRKPTSGIATTVVSQCGSL
ncbi:hypothetical protein WOLCODRAFT_157987 [Wolfiporia cocos MD-104 SS10]|uniref:Uncharacterized protein n=1 Tax=Wolfiporia cocos (strain MD-104) TaxID=742152 RepID=A0A2H3J4U2_WOLCO|nr:hypothetical protein WOLCODRAFT_157987 [Wolfiporia cocos MD-104 SS10]